MTKFASNDSEPMHPDFLQSPETERIIRTALAEDIGPGDFTTLSTVPAGRSALARCIIKDEGILAGVALAARIFQTVDPALAIDLRIHDGTAVKHGDIAFFAEGDPRSILQAERLVLNCMQRMSGIATLTHKAVQEIQGTGCAILDTRKTTPGFRHFEKWAVSIGGGQNHRFGLYDMVMIKDNHTDYAGGIGPAIRACKAFLKEKGLNLRIEVETRNLAEIEEALAEGGIQVIMLDNMDLDTMRKAVRLIDGRVLTEASGNMTWGRLRPVAETGVNYISMGSLTHSVRSMDISLKAFNPAKQVPS